VLRLPLGASAPLHPPDAVQAVALLELHVKVDAAPVASADGAALSVAAGTGCACTGVTVTTAVTGALVPPLPLQVNE
jgi:hypothetical protein